MFLANNKKLVWIIRGNHSYHMRIGQSRVYSTKCLTTIHKIITCPLSDILYNCSDYAIKLKFMTGRNYYTYYVYMCSRWT